MQQVAGRTIPNTTVNTDPLERQENFQVLVGLLHLCPVGQVPT